MNKGLVVRAAGFLMIVQVLSRILGYARDVVLQNMVGRGFASDAFNAAFSIPDFIYNIIIGGAISAAFIPVFSSYLTKGQNAQAWRTSSIFTTWVLLLMVVLLTLGFIFAEQLMGLLTQFSPEQMALPVALTRITLIQALFMALSAIATGILQSNQHFTWPAIGILLYNLCIILGGILLIKPIEAAWPGYGVAGFSVGVVVGAIMTLVVQIPTMKQMGFKYRPTLDTHDEGFRQIVRLIIPVVIGLSVTQINMMVSQYLATGLEDGILTSLRTANRFMQLPMGVFAASIAVAIFPTMTRQVADKDYAAFKKSITTGLSTSLFTTIPSAVGLALLASPIIRLAFEFSDNFTGSDTYITSQALVFYCIGLAAYGAIFIALRGFYSIHNTKMPLFISIVAIFINLALSLLLVNIMGYRGLALAYSLAGIIQFVLLMYFLHRKIGSMGLSGLLRSIIRICIASAAMGLAVWGSMELCELLFGVANKFAQILQVGVSVLVGVGVYFIAASLMRMEEMQMIKDILRRRKNRASQ